MGVELADKAAEYGAIVDLVLGPVNITPRNSSINIINVTTAQSMTEECISRFPSCDIAILAAAVADYTPAEVSGEKLKKESADLFLKLKPTTDIAVALGQSKKPSQILAGFALETDNEIDNAKGKLIRKNLDIIILNSLREEGAGFGHDTNKITIIDRNNIIDKFELKSKEDASTDILEKIISLIR
jgi:phosphopantothenoylcysteine decarboxylase/phosphopantothenate--cysteine ligase